MDDSWTNVEHDEDISRSRGRLLSDSSDAEQRRGSPRDRRLSTNGGADTPSNRGRLLSSSSRDELPSFSRQSSYASTTHDEDASSSRGRLLSSGSIIEQSFHSRHNSTSTVRYDADYSRSREHLPSSTLDVEHPRRNLQSRNSSHASWVSAEDLSTLRGTSPHASKITFNVSPDDRKAFDNRRLSHHRPYWLRSWTWELGSIAFSFACIGAIITILLFTRGKPLSSWKLLISPNAVISVFNTAAEYGMLVVVAGGIGQLKWIYFQQQQRRMADMELFDEASRGPWGAVELLLRIRWRAAIASAGAAITIASLAMDPFAQQILQYSNGPTVMSNGVASITKAEAFDLGSAIPQWQTMLVTTAGNALNEGWHPGVQQLNEALRKSIYAPTAQGSVFCSTGNCTWPEFTTLGICGTCDTVTDLKIEVADDMPEMASISPGSATGYTVLYTTPRNITLSAIFSKRVNSPQPLPPGTMLSAHSVFDTAGNGLLKTSFIRFGTNYYDTKPWDGGKAHRVAPITASNAPLPEAYDCRFQWCARTYEPTFRSATLEDNESMAFPLDPPENCLYNNTLHECTAYAGSKGQRSAYRISPKSALYLQNDLQSFLNETLVASTSSNADASALSWANDGNITKTVEDIARSLTNYIREGPNSTTVEGQTWASEPYIHVHWAWLTLPMSLVSSSAIFLAVCIYRSEIVWKNSALVMLFHGYGDWDKEALHVTSLDGMVDAAENTWVRLTENDRGKLMLMAHG